MPRKTIPIVRYDCSKCPGYCCSYPRIEVKDRDVARLARHFGLEHAEAEKRCGVTMLPPLTKGDSVAMHWPLMW